MLTQLAEEQKQLIVLLKHDIAVRDEVISGTLKTALAWEAAEQYLAGWRWYHWLSPRRVVQRVIAQGRIEAERYLREPVQP